MTVATRGLLLALLGLASVAVLVADVKITQVTVVTRPGGSAPVTVVARPASGSASPLGATTVTETATDALGVMAVCTFTVTVTAPPPPPPPGTSIVLEDFSGPMKQNGDSPPSPLWSPYNDSSSPSQTGGIVNGAYVLTVPSGN